MDNDNVYDDDDDHDDEGDVDEHDNDDEPGLRVLHHDTLRPIHANVPNL